MPNTLSKEANKAIEALIADHAFQKAFFEDRKKALKKGYIGERTCPYRKRPRISKRNQNQKTS